MRMGHCSTFTPCVMRAGTGLGGDLHALSQLWRQKQLEFTWLRALMDRYEDFWHVTEAALRTALAQLHIEASEPQIQQLLNAYLTPAVFPDARAALEALHNFPRAILSNGTPAMLEAAVQHNRLDVPFRRRHFGGPVENLQTVSPGLSARTRRASSACRGDPLRFIECMGCAGAKAFGYSVCWCNRSGRPMDQLGFAPDIVVSSLEVPPSPSLQ